MNDNSNQFSGQTGFIWWIGVVEDRQDPLKLGRVRVRCVGWHSENKNLLPKPIAVSINLIEEGDYFNMGQYSQSSSGFGFGDYDNNLIEGGDLLEYGNIY